MNGTRQNHVPPEGGPMATLLKILSSTLRDRSELVRIEFEEEKGKYLGLLVWTLIAVIGGTHALLLTSLVAIFLVPQDVRPLAAVALVLIHWILTAWAAIRARSILRATGKPFETTVNELRKDLACLETDE